MEQKRTLWIVAAVGVFLLVVVGAAVILSSSSLKKAEPVQTYYNPADGFVNTPKRDSAQAYSYPNSVEPAGITPVAVEVQPEESGTSEENRVAPLSQTDANSSVVYSTTPVKVENVTVITDNTVVYGKGSTTTIDLNTLKSGEAPVSSVTPVNQKAAEQMASKQKPAEKYTPAPDSYYAPAPKKESESVSSKPAKKESKPAATTAKAAPKAPAKTSAKAPAKPAAPDSFWIQVGSYTEKKSADTARSLLEDKKIRNEVFTYKDAKGKLFYRVRVGPFTTKSEAEYWQSRIKMINEFAKTDSYITNK